MASTLTLSALETQFNLLSIKSVVFASLSALFGAYIVLFILALWSTYRREGVAYKRLRLVTILLFIILVIHYISRAIATARARLLVPASDEEARFTVPLQFVTATTSTLAAFIFDGTLAWRFYVIFGRPRWALYFPASVIIANTLLGLSADLLNIAFYIAPQSYASHLDAFSFQLVAAWGWCIFATNTLMTGAIIAKIMYVSRITDDHGASAYQYQYHTLLEAIVESAAVTWFGLLFYEIATTAPTHGRVTNVQNIGYVLICILPVFFGISHCLITVRLGLASDGSNTAVSRNTGLPSVDSATGAYKFQARAITVTMMSESSGDESMAMTNKEAAGVALMV